MPDNDFYKGILVELEKLGAGASTNALSTASSATPPKAAPPSTTPTPSTQLGGSAPGPAAPPPLVPGQRFHNVSTNLSGAFLPHIQQGFHSLPPDQWKPAYQQWKDHSQQSYLATHPDEYKNNPLVQGATEYSAKNFDLAHPIDSTAKIKSDIQGFEDSFNGFGDEDERTQASELRAWGKTDPNAQKLYDGITHDAVNNKVDNMGAGDMWDAMTGQHQDPNMAGILKDDPGLKAYATDRGIGRAGQLAGQFLTNNWSKIALVVGGSAALVAILKTIMGGNQQPAPQQQPQTGPRFL